MSHNLKLELVDMLVRVPATASETGRTLLLTGIPASLWRRDHKHHRNDIKFIVEQSFNPDCYAEDRHWCLCILLENAIRDVSGTELAHELEDLKQKLLRKHPLVSQLMKPDNFDLEYVSEKCLNSLPPRPELVGFTLVCHSPLFLTFFCQRLKQEWYKGHINIHTLPTVRRRHGSVRNVMAKLAGLRRKVAWVNLLLTVEVDDFRQVAELWQKMTHFFGGDLTHYVVVVFVVKQADSEVNGVTHLETAQFNENDVSRWAHKVIKHLTWPHEVAEKWVYKIMMECGESRELNMELLYNYLKDEVPELLREYRTPQAFLGALAER